MSVIDLLAITENDAHGLCEFAAHERALGPHLRDCAERTEEPEVKAACLREFRGVARSYRQTLAMKQRRR